MRVTAYIGLGSNQQDPVQQLSQAIAHIQLLAETNLINHSSFYWNTFEGDVSQPDCLNAVAAISTDLSPELLLKKLLAIEDAAGRIRQDTLLLPRTLDLDLLLYGDYSLQQPGLVVPHPRMLQRNFVLFPLAEIAPDLILPSGQSIKALLATSHWEGARVANIHHFNLNKLAKHYE